VYTGCRIHYLYIRVCDLVAHQLFLTFRRTGHRQKKIVFTPKVGGKITETLFDGSQTDWGKVLEFTPVRKLVIAWHISITERKATRIDIAFRENGDRSVVTLTHSD
jgi:hypothetical protein